MLLNTAVSFAANFIRTNPKIISKSLSTKINIRIMARIKFYPNFLNKHIIYKYGITVVRLICPEICASQ
jgi:hypothetical protein